MGSEILKGKTVWITGSSRGIGRVVAMHLASLGAKTAIHGTSKHSTRSFNEADSIDQVAEEIAGSTGSDVMAVTGDLTDPNAVDTAVAEITDRFGRIDFLVNCAGGDIGARGIQGSDAGKPVDNNPVDIPVDDLKTVMDRNFLTCVLCCRAVAPAMRDSKSGAIVNVGSIAGLVGLASSSIYGSAKAAVHEYTRCLATYMREFGVRVNAVAPGEIVTPRFVASRVVDENRMTTEGALTRYGTPMEIARVIEMLITEQGSYITGQIIRIDGGAQCWPA
jgi:3-oxoacyl-[acyl-carrier protein] reductase